MELTIEQFERIEAYLQGHLDTIKILAFEAEMAQNPALKEEVEAQRQIRFGLEVLAIEQRIKAAHQRYVEQEQDVEVQAKIVPLGRTKTTSFSYTNWAAAASVVMILGLGGWWYQDRYYISSDAMAMTDQEMTYKNLPKVLPDSASIIDRNSVDLQKAQWFIALARIQAKDKKEAVRLLKLIAKTDGHPYQTKAKKLLKKL